MHWAATSVTDVAACLTNKLIEQTMGAEGWHEGQSTCLTCTWCAQICTYVQRLRVLNWLIFLRTYLSQPKPQLACRPLQPVPLLPGHAHALSM